MENSFKIQLKYTKEFLKIKTCLNFIKIENIRPKGTELTLNNSM